MDRNLQPPCRKPSHSARGSRLTTTSGAALVADSGGMGGPNVTSPNLSEDECLLTLEATFASCQNEARYRSIWDLVPNLIEVSKLLRSRGSRNLWCSQKVLHPGHNESN
jgi:hypothetical protein